jgi:putative hydrolase of the HAD superfamily
MPGSGVEGTLYASREKAETHRKTMDRSLPRAILFDLDDTILAFSDTADEAWPVICEQFAPDLDVSAATLLQSINETRDRFWRDSESNKWGRHDLVGARRKIVADAIRGLNSEIRDLHLEMVGAYAKMRQELLRPFPGAIETLDHLKAEGVSLALLTNGDAEGQRNKVERFELGSRFDCILIEGEFGVGKPEKRVYHHALDQVESSPENSWMVGDNLEWEVAVPQSLGLVGIWVDFAGKGLPKTTEVKPDYIVRSISELTKNQNTVG